MTTLDDFRTALNANPHDFHLMGVYADFLSEIPPQYAKCRRCNGDGEELWTCKVCGNSPNDDGVVTHGRGCYAVSSDGGGEEVVRDDDINDCPHCAGTGEVLDDTNSQLAEGYRALATVRPVYDVEQNCWWGWQSHMPPDWYLSLCGGKRGVDQKKFDSPSKALDAAALAFAGLPEYKKHDTLTTGPWAQGGVK